VELFVLITLMPAHVPALALPPAIRLVAVAVDAVLVPAVLVDVVDGCCQIILVIPF
jgi:hypothetical protein